MVATVEAPPALSEEQVKRLRGAVAYSRQKLEPFRRVNFEGIQQLVGYHYGDNGTKEKVPVNLLRLAVEIHLRTLAARAPQVMVSTPHMQLKPRASDLEAAINHLVDEIKLRNTIRAGVHNALFSVGIFKTGICSYGTVEINGVHHDVGQPFCDVVHLDDWVHDISARTFEEIQFCGNRYRLPIDAVKDNPIYDAAAREALQKTEKKPIDDGQARTESLSQGDEGGGETFYDYVELWDLWLPLEGLIVTLSVDNETAPPLRVVKWEGPENGPYHILSFSDVPNNVMPNAPVNAWRDIHEIENALYCKLARQALRQKTILGVAGGADPDGNRIVKAEDGDATRIDRPEAAKEYSFGGIHQGNMLFFTQSRDLFSYQAGNLDTLGGLSPMADTAKQEELLGAASNKQTADMQDVLMDVVERIIRDLAWWLWTDPLIEIPLTKRVQGVEADIPVTFSPESREGDFLDYNFTIKPYSMQHDSPSQRAMAVMQIWNETIMPSAQMMAQSGMQPNIEGYLRTIAKLRNIDELEELVVFAGPPMAIRPEPIGQPERGTVGPAKPAVTTRRYERINRPGATRQGKDEAMAAMLTGMNQQPKQQAQLMRQVG